MGITPYDSTPGLPVWQRQDIQPSSAEVTHQKTVLSTDLQQLIHHLVKRSQQGDVPLSVLLDIWQR